MYGAPDRHGDARDEEARGGGGGYAHPSRELTARHHDDVAALIDAYVR